MSFAPSIAAQGGREISLKDLRKEYPGATQTVVVTKPVRLTLAGYKRVTIPVGVHEIPQAILNDEHLSFYLQAHGAKPHMPEIDSKLPEVPDDEDEDEVPTIENLNKLNKSQLLAMAKNKYSLELDPADKKDDLILAIIEAAEPKE
jgi:hypothetical protein